MKLIDIHCHLDHARFKKDLSQVIERAKKKNMIIITSGVNPATNKIALEIAEKYDNVKVSFGLYPLDALEKEIQEAEKINNEGVFPRDIEPFNLEKELEYLKKNKNKFAAIGEIGLDYNWPEFQSEKIKQEQKENFIKILKVAKEIDLPVIVHTRKAELDCVEILEEFFPASRTNNKKDGATTCQKVILHCFMGRKHLIKKAVENKWFFSVPPIITRLLHFQNLVELVPLSQLLTETDAPYLSPTAGERNEPANVRFTIKEIAKIKGISEKEVGKAIWENAEGLGLI